MVRDMFHMLSFGTHLFIWESEIIDSGNCRVGVVVGTVASQQEGFWFESRGPFCVELACSSCACVGSHRVRLPPTTQKHVCWVNWCL